MNAAGRYTPATATAEAITAWPRYFGQLAAWGYGLSDVERVVIDKVAENAAAKAAEEAAKTTE